APSTSSETSAFRPPNLPPAFPPASGSDYSSGQRHAPASRCERRLHPRLQQSAPCPHHRARYPRVDRLGPANGKAHLQILLALCVALPSSSLLRPGASILKCKI